MIETEKDAVSKCTKLLKYAQSQKRNVKEQGFCFYFTVVVEENSTCFNKHTTEQSKQIQLVYLMRKSDCVRGYYSDL